MAEGKKVVIFDDDEDILSICQFILEEEGWLVITYNDCDEVEYKVGLHQPNIILMDNWIPADGGIVATQILKNSASLQHIPVIFFSANSDIAKLAELAGAEDFISKPFDLDALTQKVDQVAKIDF